MAQATLANTGGAFNRSEEARFHSDNKMRYQFAQILQNQGIQVDEFIRLCDVNGNGTIEKVELVLVLKNMGCFEIDEILQLSKILLPSAIESTQNFRLKMQLMMEDYDNFLVNNNDLSDFTEMKVSPGLRKRLHGLEA